MRAEVETVTRLRYIGVTPERCSFLPTGHKVPGLVKGIEYRVAEIFEDPGYLMVYSAANNKWPMPGDALFGLAPELFESSSTEIEIRSCGYTLNTLTYEMYGVALTDPSLVAACEAFEAAVLQHCQGQVAQSAIIQSAQLFASQVPETQQPTLLVYRDVAYPKCECLGFLGFWYKRMVEVNLMRDRANWIISAYTQAAEVKIDGSPGEIAVRFWCGDGSPRRLTP